jgi:protein TonB
MFEQSLLLDHAAGKKTGAMAASLTAQTAFVGILIALPLIFGDRLPDVRKYIPLSLPLPPPPPLPQQETTATSSSSSHSSATPFKTYRPTPTTNLSQVTDVALIDAPPSFAAGVDSGVPGGTGPVSSLSQFTREQIPPPKPHVADSPASPASPQRVGGDVQAAKLVRKVMPVYPPMARQVRVSGTVELIGIIEKDGTIQQLQVVSGHPLLIKAALDAVRQWVYHPTLLNGQAVEVIAPISVHFTLSQQ